MHEVKPNSERSPNRDRHIPNRFYVLEKGEDSGKYFKVRNKLEVHTTNDPYFAHPFWSKEEAEKTKREIERKGLGSFTITHVPNIKV